MDIPITSLVLLGTIFLLFVIACIVLITSIKSKPDEENSIYSKDSHNNTSYWKTVKGHILQATIDYREHKTFFRSAVKQYRTRITYEYFAYDKKYSSETALNYWTKDKDQAKTLFHKHQQGNPVIVRFHPKSPETSIIELNR